MSFLLFFQVLILTRTSNLYSTDLFTRSLKLFLLLLAFTYVKFGTYVISDWLIDKLTRNTINLKKSTGFLQYVSGNLTADLCFRVISWWKIMYVIGGSQAYPPTGPRTPRIFSKSYPPTGDIPAVDSTTENNFSYLYAWIIMISSLFAKSAQVYRAVYLYHVPMSSLIKSSFHRP